MKKAYLVLAVMFVPSAVSADDPSARDLQAMQGYWVIESATIQGKRYKPAEGCRAIITENVMVTREGTHFHKTFFQLDASKNPKRMVMQQLDEDPSEKDGSSVELLTIYKLDAEKLTVCTALPTGSVSEMQSSIPHSSDLRIVVPTPVEIKRPKSFEPGPANSVIVYIRPK
jgi:uncharacterized protein (TIGR03067 family)